ncbi:DUF6705 family protein [Flavobacterium enshiense]|uniref:DUF6705 family protein n=1 Tax=Flavobacterium enshiense TaxID=1341165 RepID=UPI00345D97B3
MNKIVMTIVSLLFYCLNSNSQIISIEDIGLIPIDGAYYKDNELLLNRFVGTWKYTNGNTSLKIIFQKISRQRANYSEDLLIGEYLYIENGVEIINTLNNISNSENNIEGNSVIYHNSKPTCNDCVVGEKRLVVSFGDPLKQTWGPLYLRKINVGGQEAISAQFILNGTRYIGDSILEFDEVYVGETFPNETYVLIKQP